MALQGMKYEWVWGGLGGFWGCEGGTGVPGGGLGRFWGGMRGGEGGMSAKSNQPWPAVAH